MIWKFRPRHLVAVDSHVICKTQKALFYSWRFSSSFPWNEGNGLSWSIKWPLLFYRYIGIKMNTVVLIIYIFLSPKCLLLLISKPSKSVHRPQEALWSLDSVSFVLRRRIQPESHHWSLKTMQLSKSTSLRWGNFEDENHFKGNDLE